MCLLVGKPDGERPLGRPRIGWKDIIDMCLNRMGRCELASFHKNGLVVGCNETLFAETADYFLTA
jgi:hypothetical protein